MKVTITFKDNIIKKINSKLNEVKRYTSKKGTVPVALPVVLEVCDYLVKDLDRLLTDCNDKVSSMIVVDKNKVILPSIISNFTDNIIRTNTREKAWQIDNYWRNGLSSLPSDYESIKKILCLGFPNETKEYDIESIEKLFNCVIALSFSILETIIKSDNLVCYEYED